MSENERAKTDKENFLSELDAFRKAKRRVSRRKVKDDASETRYRVNPSLELIKLTWDVLPFLSSGTGRDDPTPDKKDNFAILWRDPVSGKTMSKYATSEEMFALKVCSESLKIEDVARETGTDPGVLQKALKRVSQSGIIFAPNSRIRRKMNFMENIPKIFGLDLRPDIFTLQWHVTHLCDLDCRHCYDRSLRTHLPLKKAMGVLEELEGFCRDKLTDGHVCFTGGNPFLYPDFFKIYRAAADKGFSTSILGNPVSRAKLKEMVNIHKPEYYQVSLEGLEDHNDFMRGKGNFMSVLTFLKVLREEEVSTAVMLTLTKDNIDQVIPLADILREHTDYFTFNRLSPVGEGAQLVLPAKERYMEFLTEYIEASRSNPILGFKDNLLNVVLEKNKEELFGGCTGYGCGAAFNFLTLLPDGEIHACRKFPSLLGNINENSIKQIYDSDKAELYREGTKGCYSCEIKHVCGGCLASAKGHGLDIFRDKDPYCFRHE